MGKFGVLALAAGLIATAPACGVPTEDGPSAAETIRATRNCKRKYDGCVTSGNNAQGCLDGAAKCVDDVKAGCGAALGSTATSDAKVRALLDDSDGDGASDAAEILGATVPSATSICHPDSNPQVPQTIDDCDGYGGPQPSLADAIKSRTGVDPCK